MKKFFYFIEYIAVMLIYLLYKILPLNYSIKFSSFLFMTFGKFSRANKTAINNCKYVFPNLQEKEVKNIIKKSWNNLGITVCELLRLREKLRSNRFPAGANIREGWIDWESFYKLKIYFS